MTKVPVSALLARYLVSADKASSWLKRSQMRCAKVDLSQTLAADDFDALENLTSRFARLADILVQKLFRLIDQAELNSAGSVIDVINRAAKRGLVENEAEMRQIRELRNAIAHDYTEEELVALFREVRTLTPSLLAVYATTKTYCERRLMAQPGGHP